MGIPDDRQRSIVEKLYADAEIGDFFNICMQSHRSDLEKLVAAFAGYSAGDPHSTVEREISNCTDIAFVADDQDVALSLLSRLLNSLCDSFTVDQAAAIAMLEQAITDLAESEKRHLLSYVSLIPDFSPPSEAMRIGNIGKEEYTNRVYIELCDILCSFFNTKQAFISLRKSSAYDNYLASYDADGAYRTEIFGKYYTPDESIDDNELKKNWIAEISNRKQMLGEPSAPFYSHLTSEKAYVVYEKLPLLLYADSAYYQMLHDHSGQHFAPLQLYYDYIQYRRSVERESTSGRFARYSGFADFQFSVLLPLVVDDVAIGLIICDRAEEDFGDITLCDDAKPALDSYYEYLVARTRLHREHIVQYVNDRLPTVRSYILETLNEEVEDEEEFIRARAIGFLNYQQKRQYFTDIGVPQLSIAEENLAKLKASFSLRRPLSRVKMKYARRFATLCSATIANIAMVDELERHGAKDVLRRVQEERSAINSALKHTGNTETSVIATNLSYISRYLAGLHEENEKFRVLFRDYSKRYQDNPEAVAELKQIATQYDRMFKQLDIRRGDVDICIERIRELRELFNSLETVTAEMNYYNIHGLIDEALNRSDFLIKTNGIAIDKRYCDEKLVVYCHKSYLIIAISQYLLNSIDALIEKNMADRWITIRTHTTAEDFCIGIEDNGIGIEKRNLPEVYGNYSSKGSEHGTGLVTAKRIIEGKAFHGGEVHLPVSTPGQGSTFSFNIPIRKEKTVPDVLNKL